MSVKQNMQIPSIKLKIGILFVVVFLITSIVAQDYDDYARRNRRRRPQQQYQQQQYGGGGPCGRFFSYINLNYNVDCGGHGGGHTGGGSIEDFIGGQHGGNGGGGGYRPQKPNRPFGGFGGGGGSAGGAGGTYGDISNGPAGFFNGPIWGTIGAFATNIGSSVGNTVGSFTNGFNEVGGGEGGHFFDGSIINSFASLFSSSPGSASPSRPPGPNPVNNNRPDPITTPVTNRPSTGSTGGLPDVDQHPVVPIVDLKPVHEDYYDEVTEQTIYGSSTNSKFRNTGRYVSGGGQHHGHNNGGLFDINYNRAFKKINRQINQAFNYLLRR